MPADTAIDSRSSYSYGTAVLVVCSTVYDSAGKTMSGREGAGRRALSACVFIYDLALPIYYNTSG